MREFKDSVTGKDHDELPEVAVEKPEPTGRRVAQRAEVLVAEEPA